MNDDATKLERLFQDIKLATCSNADAAFAALSALHAEAGRRVESAKGGLFATTLAWTDLQAADARWIHDASQRLAAASLQVTEGLRREVGPEDLRTLQATAFALLALGETTKWEIVCGVPAPRDYRSLHGLMRQAIAAGRQRTPLQLESGGRLRACTLEALYFRALLMARFAGGNLSCAQIEILDEWLWMWAPVLQSMTRPPAGAALRVDLDSADGLRRGPREDDGPALYLPQGPIHAAFRSLVAQFHAGRIVPEEGLTASFRIEEHIAVLDLVRRGLKASQREPVARAQRRMVGHAAEVHVGLAEIEQRGFRPAGPAPAVVTLATRHGVARGVSRIERERETALGEIYDPMRRLVTITDASDSGVGLEGPLAACDAMAMGSLVGLRLAPSAPLIIGRVARKMPAIAPGRTVVGVRRISSAAKRVTVTALTGPGTRRSCMLYVPGDDPNGGHDAYLIAERTYDEGRTFEAVAGGSTYSFRFNRVRERGAGWVLAGFEILAARPRSVAA